MTTDKLSPAQREYMRRHGMEPDPPGTPGLTMGEYLRLSDAGRLKGGERILIDNSFAPSDEDLAYERVWARIMRHSPDGYHWLVQRHPRLLAGKPVPRLHSYGDGWRHILDLLLRDIAEVLSPEEMEVFEIEHIGQKVGKLKFHCRPPTGKLREIVALAKERSAVTCEACGGPGTIAMGGGDGYTACCAPCRAKREQEWNEAREQQQRRKRQRAVDQARASCRLSGTILPPEIEELNARFIEGGISTDEHVRLVIEMAEAIGKRKREP